MEYDINRKIESLSKEYCLEENEKNKTNLLNLILIKIKNDNQILLDLMKNIREFFSSSKDLIRQTSMLLIVRILERIANLKMDFQFYMSLIELGLNKMKDVVIALSAVKLIYNVLLKLKTNFPNNIFTCDSVKNKNLKEMNEIVVKILDSFSTDNFNVPAYPLEIRNYSYLIFEFLLENLEEFYLKRIPEYLQIVVDAIDGEKDPRNILKMFALISKICKRYFSDNCKYEDSINNDKMENLCKSFFDTLEIYYPIEFTQPKNSPDKITSSDLSDALNNCFASSDLFMEYLIEVLQEKFSTTSNETKLEALKTIRAINLTYSRKVLNEYFITLLNLILNEVLNNDDELLHIESLITFKDLIKKYCEELYIFKNLEKDIISENIGSNVSKIFEKCEGLIFNSETLKNSYDAKDIMVILIEYKSEFRLKALQISIKLISIFLNDNKKHYLKNSNTILFYALKNFSCNLLEKKLKDFDETGINSKIDDNNSLFKINDNKANEDILNYLKNNKNIFINLVYTLLKRDFAINGDKEEVVFISEFISNFLIKTETLIFSEIEIKNIFEFIFNVWKTADLEIENNLSTCIVALTIKFEFLENYKTINLFFQTKIDYLIKMMKIKLEESDFSNNDDVNIKKLKLNWNDFNYKEINKYLNLFIKFFTVEKISNYVLKEYFRVYLNIKNFLILFFNNKNIKLFQINDDNFKNNYTTINLNYESFKIQTNKDKLIEISEVDLKNLYIYDEEKLYNMLILIYHNISENLLKIINQNIQILNLKKDSEENNLNGDCCKQEKLSKSSKTGCCQNKNNKISQKSKNCCEKEIKIDLSDADMNYHKIQENKNDKINKSFAKCKNKEIQTEESNSEIILKNNIDILFESVSELISLNNLISQENEINSFFYFQIIDFEIFDNSIKIIENYLKSDFISKKKIEFLQDLVIKILQKINSFFNKLDLQNENLIDKIIKYYLIVFNSKTNRNIYDAINLKDNKIFLNKSQKDSYIKYFLKILHVLLKMKHERNLNHSINEINNDEIEGEFKRNILLVKEIQLFSENIKNIITNEISRIFFNKNFQDPNYIVNYNTKEKDYFAFIYMLSLDNELLYNFSNGKSNYEEINIPNQNSINLIKNNSSCNDKKTNIIQDLTEDEKQNILIFTSESILKDHSLSIVDFNFNFFEVLIYFTKLNNFNYKISGFNYFSLYYSLNKKINIQKINMNNSIIRNIEFGDLNKVNNKMDIEEINLSADKKENKIITSNYFYEKIKEMFYNNFVESYEKILNINKLFEEILKNNSDEIEKKKLFTFNIFENLNEINKFKNFLNYICFINDKNTLDIMKNFLQNILSFCNNLRILEINLNQRNLEIKDNIDLIYLYFYISFFLKTINGNINFNLINFRSTYINSDSLKNKIKINFLKFNKKVYENHFSKNNLNEFMIIFKNFYQTIFIENEKKIVIGKEDLLMINEKLNKEDLTKKYKFFLKAIFNSCMILENNIYETIIANFILNFYINFDFETLQENLDTILDQTLEFISKGICLEKAAENLKNIIQYTGKNFLQRRGYNLINILENLVKVLYTTYNLELKCDILFIIYKIIQNSKFIKNDKIFKKISTKLKNLLNNRKRKIRKYAGLCINLICLKLEN